jgi:hypothetical protein
MISSTLTLKKQIKLWGTNAGIARALALMGAAVYLASIESIIAANRAFIKQLLSRT